MGSRECVGETVKHIYGVASLHRDHFGFNMKKLLELSQDQGPLLAALPRFKALPEEE
jgi:hypothetical protein